MHGPCGGAFLHFRCKVHRAEGWEQVSSSADYKCDVKGCKWPAFAYWDKRRELPVPAMVEINYDV